MDTLVKNELARSMGIFFLTLVFFSILFTTGIVEMPGYAPFVLAFITTAVTFLALIWSGKNPRMVNIPGFFSLHTRMEKFLFILLVFFIYLTVSLLYPVSVYLWPVFLLFMVIFLLDISFKTGEHYQVNLTKWLFFSIVVSLLIVIHDFIIGNATMSTLIFIAILGMVSIVIVVGYKKISGNPGERGTEK
jgi:hypothetical protein